MVNSTFINKTKNHLWPQIIEHKNKPYMAEHRGPGFRQAQECDGITPNNMICIRVF
jgi:hypothetical protein